MSSGLDIKGLKKRLRVLNGAEHDAIMGARLARAAGLLGVIFLFGTFGYYVIGEGEYDLLTCAYMTIITLTSVGFTEAIEVTGHQDRVIFTMVLVILGMGVMLYFVSTLTAFIVDGDLRDILNMRRMKKNIGELEGHYIVAGLGDTGQYVLREMVQQKQPVLLIERDYEQYSIVTADYEEELPYVIGDATEDHVLLEAGIGRAAGVVFSLGNDRDNLFATLTARGLNEDITIVTRGEKSQSEQKFKHAGATSVIFTNQLGGMRMAAEVLRPEVTSFLELMMQDHGETRRIEELDIPVRSPFIGAKLRQVPLRKHTDALVIAVHDVVEDDYTFNPGPDLVFSEGNRLIVLALLKDIPKIEKILRGELT